MVLLWVVCFVALSSTLDAELADAEKVVYGADDRLDYYDRVNQFGENDIFAKIARESIVALMRNVGSPNANGVYELHRGGSGLGLCSGERFNDQATAAGCSGTLVSTNKVITAGHCITSQSDCRSRKFVFNFYVTGYRNGQPQYAEIRDSDIYSCTSVVTRNSNGNDWAVATLDRHVPPSSGHFPIPFLSSENRARTAGEELVMIGFPSGLPMKIEDGGTVIDPNAGHLKHFEATTDAFAGNSGSGVFTKDLQNPVMIGILVRGQTDYLNRGSCRVVNQVCDGGQCGTESISYAFHAAAHVNGDEPPQPPPGPPQEPPSSNGGSLQCGQTVSGSTVGRASTLGNSAGDMFYTFNAGQATEAVFDLCAVDYDSFLRIYDASGIEIANNDDHEGACGSNRFASHLSTALTPGQEYRVLVEGFGDNSGTFSLAVTCDEPDTPTGDSSDSDDSNGGLVPPEGCSCVRTVHPDLGVIDRCAQHISTDPPFCYVTGSCASQPSGRIPGSRWADCVLDDDSDDGSNPAPVDCVMNDWVNIGACSESCGGGLQTQTRSVRIPAANGGASCGPTEQTIACNNNPCTGCPLDGHYLGRCEKCIYSAQCAEGWYCCPFMKRCVETGSTSCSTPIADCNPRCFENAENYPDSCTGCSNSDFPNNWVSCPTNALTFVPTVEPTLDPTVDPSMDPTSDPTADACGNGVCEFGEMTSCPSDCEIELIDAICDCVGVADLCDGTCADVGLLDPVQFPGCNSYAASAICGGVIPMEMPYTDMCSSQCPTDEPFSCAINVQFNDAKRYCSNRGDTFEGLTLDQCAERAHNAGFDYFSYLDTRRNCKIPRRQRERSFEFCLPQEARRNWKVYRLDCGTSTPTRTPTMDPTIDPTSVLDDGPDSGDNTLQCGSSVSGSTVGRPNQVGNPSGEVTYEFTAQSSLTVTFDLCDSGFDTYLRILDDSGNEVTGNDDHRGLCGSLSRNSLASYLETNVQAGRTYMVVVEGFSANEGDFQLDVTCENGGDEVGTIACGSTVSGTTVGSSSIIGNNAGDAIFEFTATQRGYEFDACLSSYDSLLRVYQGAAADLRFDTQMVAMNDDHDGECSGSNRWASHLSVSTTIGETYTLVVEGYSSREGEFVVTTQCD